LSPRRVSLDREARSQRLLGLERALLVKRIGKREDDSGGEAEYGNSSRGRQRPVARTPAPGVFEWARRPSLYRLAAQKSTKVERQLDRRCITVFGLLAQAFQADRFKVARQRRV